MCEALLVEMHLVGFKSEFLLALLRLAASGRLLAASGRLLPLLPLGHGLRRWPSLLRSGVECLMIALSHPTELRM